MGLIRNESAALLLLDQLEAHAELFAASWTEATGDDGAPFLHGPNLVLYGLAPEDDGKLRPLKLLLDNVHTLIVLSRLGIEGVNSFEQVPRTGWPPARCRHCGSPNIFVFPRGRAASGRGTPPGGLGTRRVAFEIACRDCGEEMVELGPLPAPMHTAPIAG